MIRGAWVLIASALGTWLGVHAMRAALTMVVWNVAEDANNTVKGAVAASVWLLGMIGAAVWVRSRMRAAFWLGVVFALLGIARQALPGEWTSPALAFSSCIVWLWWWPSFVAATPVAARFDALAIGPVAGILAAFAGQTALGGLDLPGRTSVLALVLTIALSAAFVGATRVAIPIAPLPDESSEGGTDPLDDGTSGGALCAGWLWLFLQVTLLANLGALGVRFGWSLAETMIWSALGLIAALAALEARTTRVTRLVAVAGLVTPLALGTGMGWRAGVTIAAVQLCAGLLLGGAARAGPLRRLRGTAGFSLGASVFFALVFAYYARSEWSVAWVVAGSILGILGVLGGYVPWPRGSAAAALSRAAAGGLAIVLALLPGEWALPPEAGPLRLGQDIRVLTYNVHQGLTAQSYPGAERIAEVIERSGANIVALQEVNRGWLISGGNDLAAWLRQRLPEYQVLYAPMVSPEFGTVIMTRVPVSVAGWRTFEVGPSGLRRGLSWARVPSVRGDLLFVTTHLNSSSEGDAMPERTSQAAALLAALTSQPRVIVAGDFNAQPTEPPIRLVREAGFLDVAMVQASADTNTWSATAPRSRIDYIFVTPDLQPVVARTLTTTASDHRPVETIVRIR